MTRAEHQVKRTIFSKLLGKFGQTLAGEAQRCESVADAHPVRADELRKTARQGQVLRAAPAQASSQLSANAARAPQLSSQAAGKMPALPGRAPAEVQLGWLVEQLERNRERYQGMRCDALAMVAQDAPAANHFDRPEIREAKARAVAGVLGQIISGLDWLLSKKRPWVKTVNRTKATTNEQQQREDAGTGQRSEG